MLATLIIWLYIFVLSFVYGVFCISLLSRIFRIDHGQAIPITIVSIAGLCFLTTLSGFLSLIMPLGLVANILFIIGGIVIVIIQRRTLVIYLRESFINARNCQKSSPIVDLTHQPAETSMSQPALASPQKIASLIIWLLFGAMSLVALAKTIEPPHNYDTGLYHAQAIRWIESYRAVPGLGNLANRLAFNSSWFLPSALFSFSFLKLGSLHVLGGLFFLIINGYFLRKSSHLLRGDYKLSNLATPALIYFSRRLFSMELSSPGTDMPATLLTWVVFLLAIEKIEDCQDDQFDLKGILILIFSSMAVMMKLSTAPILILPFYFIVRELMVGKKVQVFLFLAAAVVLFTPWLIRNVILSGYLIYPVAMIDLFNVDWKIPLAYVKDTAVMVTSWARLPGQDSQIVSSLSFAKWAMPWWNVQQNFDRLILIGIGIGSASWAVFVGVRSLVANKIPNEIIRYLIIYTVGWLGLGYWFINAPAFRFGYGFLIIFLCLLIVPVVQWGMRRIKWIALYVMYSAIVVLLFYQAYGIYKLRNNSQFDGRWLLPADYPSAEVALRTLGDFDTNMPTRGDQCWYASLPCTPTHNPEVHMRGKGLQDGFYNKNMRPSIQKEKIPLISARTYLILILSEPVAALHQAEEPCIYPPRSVMQILPCPTAGSGDLCITAPSVSLRT